MSEINRKKTLFNSLVQLHFRHGIRAYEKEQTLKQKLAIIKNTYQITKSDLSLNPISTPELAQIIVSISSSMAGNQNTIIIV
jgi:hypothetical protein